MQGCLDGFGIAGYFDAFAGVDRLGMVVDALMAHVGAGPITFEVDARKTHHAGEVTYIEFFSVDDLCGG